MEESAESSRVNHDLRAVVEEFFELPDDSLSDEAFVSSSEICRSLLEFGDMDIRC